MLKHRPPHHPHHGHPAPPHHPHHGHPVPPHHSYHDHPPHLYSEYPQSWENPLPNDEHLQLLGVLFGNPDLASSVWRNLKQQGPAEIGAVAAIMLQMLKVFMEAFPDNFSFLETNRDDQSEIK